LESSELYRLYIILAGINVSTLCVMAFAIMCSLDTALFASNEKFEKIKVT